MGGRRLRQTLGVTAALAALVLTMACDGIIAVRGRVYEQRRPNAQSRAYIDRTPDDDLSGLAPLEGVKVTLYHAKDYDKEKLDPSTAARTSGATTDASGEFSAGGTTAPSKFNAALVVEKPGYRPVTQIFPHGEHDHTAVVILVPDTNP